MLAVRIFDMYGRQHPLLHLEKLILPGTFKSARIAITGPNAAVPVIVDLSAKATARICCGCPICKAGDR